MHTYTHTHMAAYMYTGMHTTDSQTCNADMHTCRHAHMKAHIFASSTLKRLNLSKNF